MYKYMYTAMLCNCTGTLHVICTCMYYLNIYTVCTCMYVHLHVYIHNMYMTVYRTCLYACRYVRNISIVYMKRGGGRLTILHQKTPWAFIRADTVDELYEIISAQYFQVLLQKMLDTRKIYKYQRNIFVLAKYHTNKDLWTIYSGKYCNTKHKNQNNICTICQHYFG